jgi:immune inhibitor A
VTLLLQDPSVGDGRYSMRSYPGAPQLSAKTGYPSCPIAPQDLEVNQYGIDVIGLNCTGDYTLVFDGETMAQVVPADPHSGDWAFWSNRGNVSDMTLTRSFDFSGTAGPIELSYWTWYDLEEDWDYVYLEASGDNGQTWQILTTPSGTGTDPTGNSYGWGYTGFSGGGTEGVWIEETADLTTYAGGPVMLRFEYITDASVNGEGLLLDDVSIAAAGYSEDFEAGDGGWQAEGFVRLYNRLPQTYRVVLVETGATTRVTEIALDETQYAEVPLSLGGDYAQATLLVMGTSRYTWRPAPYRFEVRP